MHTQTLIIGGGLSGLSLAYRLQQAGHDYRLVDARKRLGGRIKSLDVQGAKFDLGPSWVWPGQHRVAQLVSALGLRLFDQWSVGDQLYEHPTGEVVRNSGFMSMAGSLRIAGGTTALTDALAAQLDPTKIQTDTSVTAINNNPAAQLTDGQSRQDRPVPATATGGGLALRASTFTSGPCRVARNPNLDGGACKMRGGLSDTVLA